MTFTGSVGMRVSMRISSPGTYTAKIIDPSTPPVTVATCNAGCNGGSNFIDVKTLATAGLYTVSLYSGVAQNATITLYNVPPDVMASTTPLPGGGAAVPLTITTPGQNAYITFQGYDYERLSWTQSGSLAAFQTTLISPIGANLTSCGYNCNGGFLEPYTLHPVAPDFTYKVFFNPSFDYTGSKTVTLYDVPPDPTYAVTPTSASTSVTFTIGTPGQNGYITFHGYPGQLLSWSQSGSLAVFQTGLYEPNGNKLTSCGYNCNGGNLKPYPLPSDETYTVFFNPTASYIGSKTITLKLTPGGSVRISGLANVGESLTAQVSETWSPPAGTPFTYQWQRCDSSGNSCADIANETAITYTVGAADASAGSRLRVKASTTNANGTTTATSPPTLRVLPPVLVLALAYQPVLLFHLGNPAPDWDADKWRPLEIDNLLAHLPAICTRQSEDPSVDTCELLTDPASQLPSHNSDQSYLAGVADASDGDCFHTVSTGASVEDCDSGPKTAIYFVPGQDSASYRYFDYWFFYRDNKPGGFFGQQDDHDGDWEGITAVLDGLDSNAVTLAYVYYAAHNGGQWYGANELAGAGSLDPNGKRATDYVARGTHASYPTSCSSSCSPPSNVTWPWESPHDGGAPWGSNDDSCAGICVKRFTEDRWTYWKGHWGSSTGWTNSFGWSPLSPGLQNRFKCAAAGYDASCPLSRPPGARPPTGLRARFPNPRLCQSWFGGQVAVLACDAKLLAEAIQKHWMRRPGKLHLFLNGRRAGDSPGLAQVIGEPLVPGAHVTITGKGTRRTVVLMAVRIKSHLYRIQVQYQDLPRSSEIRLKVGLRGSRPFVGAPARAVRAKVTRVR